MNVKNFAAQALIGSTLFWCSGNLVAQTATPKANSKANSKPGRVWNDCSEVDGAKRKGFYAKTAISDPELSNTCVKKSASKKKAKKATKAKPKTNAKANAKVKAKPKPKSAPTSEPDESSDDGDN